MPHNSRCHTGHNNPHKFGGGCEHGYQAATLSCGGGGWCRIYTWSGYGFGLGQRHGWAAVSVEWVAKLKLFHNPKKQPAAGEGE